jgi:hypothetical protein
LQVRVLPGSPKITNVYAGVSSFRRFDKGSKGPMSHQSPIVLKNGNKKAPINSGLVVGDVAQFTKT